MESFRSFETSIFKRLNELESNICHCNTQDGLFPFSFNSGSPRTSEIQKFNATVHTETYGRVFTYYWKLEYVRAMLLTEQGTGFVRSSSFYIYSEGYRMYLKFFPKNNNNILLLQVGITTGKYDDKLKWPFALKYRVNVLDQFHPINAITDIVSEIWDPQTVCQELSWRKPVKDNPGCTSISFSMYELHVGQYIKNNSIIFKITIFI